MLIIVKIVNSILDLLKLQFKSARVKIVKLALHVSNFVVLTCKSTSTHHPSSTIYLCVNSQPTIEASQNLKFAPYNFGYPGLEEHLKESGIDMSNTKYNYRQQLLEICTRYDTWN